MNPTVNYDEIMSNRKLFNEFVYTPLSEALKILDERQKDPVLMAKVHDLLKGDIPVIFKKNTKYGVQFRQVATPNNDTRHFLSISQDNNLEPVIFEYHDDKFTSNNDFKHSLGQLRFHDCANKKDVYPIEKITIVDFNKYNGKKLKEVKTLSDDSLIDFHKKLFLYHNYDIKSIKFYDASDWFKNNGGKAADYYYNFFLLFVCFGILFENFLLNDEGADFTREVILPAIDRVILETGFRPLIIPIGPLDIETDDHWISYNPNIKHLVK